MGRPGPQYTRYNDFSEGQNDTVNEALANPRAASRARNVDLDRDGAISKRSGANELHTGLAGTPGEVGMICQFRPSAGVEKKLICYATRVAEWDGATTVTDLLTGFTKNTIWINAPFRNFLYLANPTDLPCLYWPSAPATPAAPSAAHRYLFRPGAPQPPAALADGGAVAGSIATNGVIKVRTRYVSVEGDEFFGEPDHEAGFSITISGAPTGWRVSNVPTYGGVTQPNFRIAKRVIERTSVGQGTFYIDGYLADNTTTNYDFTQSDVDLVGGSDIGPNPGWRLSMPSLYPFAKFKERIVGADPSDIGKIIWSEIDEFGILPSFFPESYYLYLDIEDEGDAPVAVAKFGEYLIWYCGRSIHMMFIDEGGTAYSRRLGQFRLGFPNPRCVIELPSGHLIWSYKGPYFFNGNEPIFIGERIETEIQNISKAGLSDMYAIHRSQERRRQVKFIFPESGGTQNNFAAKYHYRRVTLNPEGFPTAHAWTFDNGFNAKSGAIMLDPSTNIEREYSGSYDGKLYEEDVTDTDDHDTDGKIDGLWRTRWLDMGTPEWVKDFEELTVTMAGEPGRTLNVQWETSWGAGPGGATAVPGAAATAAVMGTAVMGTAVLFGGDTFERQMFLGQDGVTAQGKRIRFTFSNSEADGPFTILELLIKWSINRDRNDAPR
jgi:hypothetical protein